MKYTGTEEIVLSGGSQKGLGEMCAPPPPPIIMCPCLGTADAVVESLNHYRKVLCSIPNTNEALLLNMWGLFLYQILQLQCFLLGSLI